MEKVGLLYYNEYISRWNEEHRKLEITKQAMTRHAEGFSLTNNIRKVGGLL